MNKILANSALFVGSIIFSLVALEVGLRAYHGNWEYKRLRNSGAPLTTYLIAAFDAELGCVPKQNVRPNLWGPTGPAVTILDDGIRSNNTGEVPDGIDAPVLAIGDSYTWGGDVPDWGDLASAAGKALWKESD